MSTTPKTQAVGASTDRRARVYRYMREHGIDAIIALGFAYTPLHGALIAQERRATGRFMGDRFIVWVAVVRSLAKEIPT